MGRPRRRLHHRLRGPAPRPRERHRGRLRCIGREHQHGGAELHRRHGGGSLTYTYRIKAINEHGTSERSRWVHIDTPAAPAPEEEQAAEPPDQPTGLSAAATHDSVTLTWDDPGDDSITGYVILRRVPGVDPQGHFNELVPDTGTDATTYTDDTVSAETRYTYRIKAINQHGVSERSRWSHINTPAAPKAAESDEQDGGGAPGGPGKRDNVSEGGTDLPDDTTTTGEVDVGGSVTGNTAQALDRDWFKVVLEAGKRYQFDVEGDDTDRGTLADPYLWGLFDSGGSSIPTVRSDDGGVGKNGRDTYTLSVIVLGANGASEANTDFPNNNTTSGRVDVGASATGNVESATDVDRFRVELEAGKQYQFDLEGAPTGRGTLEDPFLSLSDSMGTVIDSDNDSGTDVNSQIVYTATATGAHYLRADKSATETGTYTLSVMEVGAEDSPCTLNEGDIWCGVVTVGEVTNSGGSTVGHGFLGTTGDIDGNPDDKDFTVPSNNNEYTITSLMVGTGSISGSLIFRLDQDLMDTTTTDDQATLELGIDGESDPFLLSTATTVSNGGYRWDGTGLDWSSETPVTVRLREGDPPTLSVADAEGDEGDGKVVFTVTLSKPYYAATSATWTASVESGDTAIAADLGTTKTGTVAFAAMATTATFEVPVANDTTDENDETFTVTLSSSAHANFVKLAADPTAKGTIEDDDDPVDDSETEEDDLPTDTSTSGMVEVNGSAARGDIHEPRAETATWTTTDPEGNEQVHEQIVYTFDTDWFAVELEADRTYRIDMTGSIPTNELTLRLPQINAIYDEGGNSVFNTWSHDESDSHHLFRVTFHAHDDGTYYIAASGESFEWGTYKLRVIDITQDVDEHPADRSTTKRALRGTPVTGRIDFNRDVDWFQMNISLAGTYTIDLEGQATGRGSLRNPLLRGVYDADGNYIDGTRNDDGGVGSNAQITRRFEVGTYYISVGAFGNYEGSYTLSVDD